MQVNAQLVRVENQALLGSITERGSMGDAAFFDLQQRLGAGVAGLLTSAVGPSKAAGQRSAGTSSVNDFAEYSAAIAMLGRRFVAGNVDQATSILEGVVARSPGFAAAHAGLSERVPDAVSGNQVARAGGQVDCLGAACGGSRPGRHARAHRARARLCRGRPIQRGDSNAARRARASTAQRRPAPRAWRHPGSERSDRGGPERTSSRVAASARITGKTPPRWRWLSTCADDSTRLLRPSRAPQS